MGPREERSRVSISDASGRTYATAAEWFAAVEKLADQRYGARKDRFPHQDHISKEDEPKRPENTWSSEREVSA
jgi:hypothetical protein